MNETGGGGSGSGRTGVEIAASVLDFYKELPFNYRQSVAQHAKGIRENDMVRNYPGMAELFQRPDTRVLEVGCGVGGFANSVAHHYGCEVTAIDFNPVATERAAEVARELSLDVTYQVADLFEYAPGRTFDVVVSLGVLHHTQHCPGAV
ncbi:MAG: class I SAM-dependent methyltransferase, partial [Proteobacteria bacterium]|nr:class I SAM-dependent methyltransferase [Pseudomonadota bacterium]